MILIPTMGDRMSGIIRCMDSIDVSAARSVLLKNSTGWLPAVNEALKDIEDYMLMGADDMTFHPGSIQKALDMMDNCYPNLDGVIGFNQANLGEFCEAGFVLMGRKFIDRFPDSQVYCPDYRHYCADTELGVYAQSIGKFTYCHDAKVDHQHFSVVGKKDKTSEVSTSYRSGDMEMAGKRKKLGYLWGHDFKRLR